jgi:hypothetical protein
MKTSYNISDPTILINPTRPQYNHAMALRHNMTIEDVYACKIVSSSFILKEKCLNKYIITVNALTKQCNC